MASDSDNRIPMSLSLLNNSADPRTSHDLNPIIMLDQNEVDDKRESERFDLDVAIEDEKSTDDEPLESNIDDCGMAKMKYLYLDLIDIVKVTAVGKKKIFQVLSLNKNYNSPNYLISAELKGPSMML
ncbi:hypothetical protein FQA39_LY08559 [Lamprigera yunnana]|nr:hypothetical protein FQA39_LY08559 [Lamprigera yunnana]